MYLRRSTRAQAQSGNSAGRSVAAGKVIPKRARSSQSAGGKKQASRQTNLGYIAPSSSPVSFRLPSFSSPGDISNQHMVEEWRSMQSVNTRILNRLEVLERDARSTADIALLCQENSRQTSRLLDRLERLENKDDEPSPAIDRQPTVRRHTPQPPPLNEPVSDPADAATQAQNLLRFWQQQEENDGHVEGLLHSSRVKSGQFRVGGEVPCRRLVAWPHDLCYLGADCKRTTYDELSPIQWVTGFLRSILKNKVHSEQINMIQLGADLFQNALDLGWPTAKGAYKVVLVEMEAGLVNWSDIDSIQEIRRQYAQRHIARPNIASTTATIPSFNGNPRPGQKRYQNEKSDKKVVCTAFQNNNCPHIHDHITQGVPYRHICAYCYGLLAKPFPHSESECLRKKGLRNGQPGHAPSTQQHLPGAANH